MKVVKQYAPSYRIVVGGKDLQLGTNVDVLSVSVTDTVDQADSFTFTVRDRHPDHKRLFAGGDKLVWMDSSTFKEGTGVEIFMGYVDDRRLMIQGSIKAVTYNFPESGPPTVQVQGFSALHDLQQKRRREPFENASDSDIAKEIASKAGMIAKVDETGTKVPLYSPKGASFAEILRQRAERNGYEVKVSGKTLYFQRPGYRREPGPVLTFEWGRNLRSFSPRLTISGMLAGVRVRGSQTSRGGGKKPVVGEALPGKERVKMGKQSASEVANELNRENTLLLNDHDVHSQEEAKEMALSKLEATSMGFIVGRGSVAGEPRLVARIVIKLEGLGQRFGGNYYVTSATHTIDSSGYRTDFEVKRNAQWPS